MIDVNRMTTRANMRWKIVDRGTNAVNHDINWRFQVGDQVKIRLVNEEKIALVTKFKYVDIYNY